MASSALGSLHLRSSSRSRPPNLQTPALVKVLSQRSGKRCSAASLLKRKWLLPAASTECSIWSSLSTPLFMGFWLQLKIWPRNAARRTHRYFATRFTCEMSAIEIWLIHSFVDELEEGMIGTSIFYSPVCFWHCFQHWHVCIMNRLLMMLLPSLVSCARLFPIGDHITHSI